MSSKKNSKRKYLTLEKKVQLIKAAQKNPGVNVRSLTEQFQCGKTQAAGILKKKESLLSMYEANFSTVQAKISRTSQHSEINVALFDWLAAKTYPGGSQLVEKARQIAAALGKDEFKVINGWLERWKTRYNVRVCGESGDLLGVTVEPWNERLA